MAEARTLYPRLACNSCFLIEVSLALFTHDDDDEDDDEHFDISQL